MINTTPTLLNIITRTHLFKNLEKKKLKKKRILVEIESSKNDVRHCW